MPDPEFFFNNPYGRAPKSPPRRVLLRSEDGSGLGQALAGAQARYWYGNFFPDMRAWDQLVPHKGRGAGGHVVDIAVPRARRCPATCRSFPARTYKKGHRHGPGRAIIIPAGEGYSIMWPEGEEKVVIPWHEG